VKYIVRLVGFVWVRFCTVLLILKDISGSFLEFRDFFPSGYRPALIIFESWVRLGSFLGSFWHHLLILKEKLGSFFREKGEGGPSQ